jgi:hypothetical protein
VPCAVEATPGGVLATPDGGGVSSRHEEILGVGVHRHGERRHAGLVREGGILGTGFGARGLDLLSLLILTLVTSHNILLLHCCVLPFLTPM